MRKILWSLTFLLLSVVAARAEVTIAALGDSLTHGFGLPQEQGFVPQMQAWLDERGVEARLINAGVSGDTTAGGAARVGWTLTPEVDGMIVALGANDMLRGIDPASARSNLQMILEAAREADVAVLLIGFPAPANFGPDYQAAFDQIYPDLAAAYDTLYAESFFVGFAVLGDEPQAYQSHLQPDRLHPTAEGVALIVEGLGPHVATLVQRIQD